MIMPYLRDMINNHKAPVKLKSLSGEIIDMILLENGKFS